MRVLGSDKPRGSRVPDGLGGFVPWTPLFPTVAVLLYAVSEKLDHGSTFWSVLAIGLATIGAATLGGAILGFLFGLPRVGARAAKGVDGKGSSGLETNSNLDEVSDWLTKILVGLGLVQLGRISHSVSHIGQELAPGFGSMPGAKEFAVALLLYSAIDGFLIGYIWTRVGLSRVFQKAHESLLTPAAREGVRAIETTLRTSGEELRRLQQAVKSAQELVASASSEQPKDADEPAKN